MMRNKDYLKVLGIKMIDKKFPKRVKIIICLILETFKKKSANLFQSCN